VEPEQVFRRPGWVRDRMTALVRKLLFPVPDPPDYDDKSFPDDLIWVPHRTLEDDSKTFIPCVFLPFKGAKRMVIYCHGNGCDLGTIYEELLRYREYWQVHVLAMEYPGYGLCTGTPDEASINAATLSVYNYVTKQLRWPSLFIFFYGRSIGSGPVCKLVADLQQRGTRVGGIILHCGYTSIRAVVSHSIGLVASALIKDRWQNIKEVKKIDCPVLLIHGQRDKLIPYTHSEQLYDTCKSQHKQLVIVAEADHNTFDEDEDIKKPIQVFLLRAAALMQKTLKYYAELKKKKAIRNGKSKQSKSRDLKSPKQKESAEDLSKQMSHLLSKPPPTKGKELLDQPPESPSKFRPSGGDRKNQSARVRNYSPDFSEEDGVGEDSDRVKKPGAKSKAESRRGSRNSGRYRKHVAKR